MENCYESLAHSILVTSQGASIIYVPNGGNWGDAVIRESTLKFFQDFAIHYHELPFINIFWRTYIQSSIMKDYLADKVLVFGGGGAWYPVYSSGYHFVLSFHRFFKHTVILPSTLMLSIDSSDITLYCRDQYESRQSCPQAIFCHDMAFYMKNKLGPISVADKQNGYFFRTDKESSGKMGLPIDNLDISLLGNEMTPIDPFINKINEYDNIYTDRLHVAIVACLLSKKVYFYKGKYFKNEVVFKSSMENHFKNIYFYL